jgi:ATP-dependent exoDNAse (exonuclease V) beta subunit
MVAFTDEQRRAIERRDGPLLVRAGAGTGKTSVLVERFVEAVVEDEVPVEGILAITFTEKAATEMKERVRARLVERGRRSEARAAEAAWISTIHRFCARVLRAHALSAGIDPEYRVLDELESQRLAIDAFDRALEALLAGSAGSDRLELVASYTPDRLRDMVRTAYSYLRSQGRRHPRLEPLAEPLDGTGVAARLSSALLAAAAELGAAGGGVRVAEALERLERCRQGLGRLSSGDLLEPGQLEGFTLGTGAKPLRSDACEEYRTAFEDYRALVVARAEYRTHGLLRELLELYGNALEALKRERSGLDFEDLELIARDLLVSEPAIRESYAARFAHVLVDEFQDVNPLQNELLGLLERDNLFRVGDESQSIYGFRHADVGVFAEHHAAAAKAGRAQSVTVNFRSRGEIIDAVDLAFSRAWGEEGFEPLRAGRADAPASEPRVELLAVDRAKGSWDGIEEEAFGRSLRAAPPWRAAEARLMARRLEEVAREGEHGWGEIVVLLRATTHMTFYERALEERGIPTHVVGGRGYWSQQQVGDLRHWLAALANPLDELSLLSVLASPLVGASLDAVALLALHARRAGRDPWWELQGAFAGDGALLNDLSERDRRRLERFAALFERERRDAPRVSLERLIDRAVSATGYDRHVLARPAGDRRMANVRKLMRMAREFEADEGRDLRAFIDFVAERDLIAGKEAEAPLEAEELQRVRLMTVHRAKGLEFPVVFVADLGKDGREERGALQLSEDGRMGLRLSSMSGGTVPTQELERIKEERRERDEAEEKRVFYVALTRAREHLVLSGATDLGASPPLKPLCEPLRWLWRVLCPGLADETGARGVHVDSWDGRDVRVRWERVGPGTLDELLPAADRVPARPAPAAEAVPEAPSLELGMLAAPRALLVTRLSYSALEDYRRCGYRFYLERALRLPGADALARDGEPAPPHPPVEGAGDELPALLRGTLVHELLERLDLRRAALPTEREVAALLERHRVPAREEHVADLRGLVGRFLSSSLRERLASARRTRAELPFCFTLVPPGAAGRSLLVNGFVDVHAVEDDRTLIVDYKSDRLEGGDDLEELCATRYATQRLVYALAALREGAERVEVVHLFLERAEDPASAVWEAADAEELERRLLALAAGVVDGAFVPTDEPHRELCADCPGQPALCVWPPERTLAAAG